MSAMLSVLEVLCTAIGAFVLYCVLMVALWTGLVRVVRHRGRDGSGARRPAGGSARRPGLLRPGPQRWDDAVWDDPPLNDPAWDDAIWAELARGTTPMGPAARRAGDRDRTGGKRGPDGDPDGDGSPDRIGNHGVVGDLGPTGLNPFGSAAAAAAARYEARQRADRRRASGRD